MSEAKPKPVETCGCHRGEVYDAEDMNKYLIVIEAKAEHFDELTISMSEDLNLTPEDFLERKEKAQAYDALLHTDLSHDEYLRAKEIAVKSVKEHLELFDKAEKMDAVREMSPEIIAWMDTGMDWTHNESTSGSERDKQRRDEYNELKKKFKEILEGS